MNDLLTSVREKAKALRKTIVLAEGEEPRIVTAAAKIQAEGIAKIILIGDPAVIKEKCPAVDLKGIKVVNIDTPNCFTICVKQRVWIWKRRVNLCAIRCISAY